MNEHTRTVAQDGTQPASTADAASAFGQGVLVLLDVSGTQRYLFGTNLLRDAVGGSYLVASIFDGVLRTALDGLEAPAVLHNLVGAPLPLTQEGVEWEMQQSLDVLVLDRRGGTASLWALDTATAAHAVRALGVALEKKAPGLDLVHVVVPVNDEPLGAALRRASHALAVRKDARPHTQGCPVVAACLRDPDADTPAASVGRSGPRSVPVSAATARKQTAMLDANDRLWEELGRDVATPAPTDAPADGASAGTADQAFRFPVEFEDVGGGDPEQRTLAVVHADGDGLGALGRDITSGAQTYAEAISRLRRFEAAVAACAQAALSAVVDAFAATWTDLLVAPTSSGLDAGGASTEAVQDRCPTITVHASGRRPVQFKYAKGRPVALPLRPVVFGGDDVTFACVGRLGLAAAHVYLTRFAEAARQDSELEKLLPNGATVTASAGVALVGLGHPFARAYALAEALTSEAKAYRRDTEAALPALSWLDATDGPDGLEAARAGLRLEVANDGATDTYSLRYAPVLLGGAAGRDEPRRWATLRAAVDAWQHPPNTALGDALVAKRKVLADALAAGPAETERALKTFLPNTDKAELPSLDGFDGQRRGFVFVRENTQGGAYASPYAEALRLADRSGFPTPPSRRPTTPSDEAGLPDEADQSDGNAPA